MKLYLLILLPIIAATAACSNVPSHSNIQYDNEFSRSKMDFWLPKSSEPTPVIVVFHGGGFRTGDKSRIPFKERFLGFRDKGIAIVSVGYPLIGDKSQTTEIGKNSRDAIFANTVKAIHFIKKNAKAYNLDTDRMAVAGSSAGAKIATHLTYRENLGFSLCIAIEQPLNPEKEIQAIKKGDPPIIFYTRSAPNDHIHNPSYPRLIHKHCQRVGVTSYLVGGKKSGLPQVPEGQSFVDYASKILFNTWKKP